MSWKDEIAPYQGWIIGVVLYGFYRLLRIFTNTVTVERVESEEDWGRRIARQRAELMVEEAKLAEEQNRVQNLDSRPLEAILNPSRKIKR